MKLKWYGHSCFSLVFSDGTTLITDPFDDTVGYPLCTARADLVLSTHDHFDHNHVQSLAGTPEMLQQPGAWDIGDIHITGTASWHDDQQGAQRGPNVIYTIEGDGVRLVHLGDLGHMPDETQLNAMRGADVLMIPIGGTFTITTPQAVEIIRMAAPKCAIAMHFKNSYCYFPITDEKEFVHLTGAVEMPGEIDVTPNADLPKAIVMRYE